MKTLNLFKALGALLLVGVSLYHYLNSDIVSAQTVRFVGPTSSQPLALSADDSLLAVANPDNNTVTFFDVRTGNVRLAEVPVGREPNGVALSPDGTRAYVANTLGGTVTVLGINRTAGTYQTVLATIPVGVEPYGVAITPSGRKVYVTNSRSHSVSVIDTSTNLVSATIRNAGIEPRGIAITNRGGDDSQETVFVTQFLSLPVPGKVDGADDAKVGRVTVISAATDTVTGEVTVNPIADTGFRAAGDSLQRIAPPATPQPEDFRFVTGAYPNQLNNIALRGRYAFLPNTGASPNGPFRFNVNTQSLLSVIDTTTRTDAGRTINMHSAVAAQTNTTRRFITVPWAIAMKRLADEGYIVSAASNIVVKVAIDPATGAPTVQSDSADPTRVLQIPTGKNPRGIVINSTDTTAYVMNYISRDVTVINLTAPGERVAATLRSANVPLPGTPEDRVHIGKELYNTSIGEFDPATAGGTAITGRMSATGWGACSSCHPFGLTDNVVWIFPSGPKRTIPQHVDFDQTDPTRNTLRALNWSAERDEEEDFELNIRAVSGGMGLIVQADGVTQDTNVANLTPAASGGRNQLKVRGVGAWDALKAYMQSGIRAPLSPVSKTDAAVVAGRLHFIESNCQNCHGGAQWSISRVRYTPAPDATLISNTQLITELFNVGTFDPQFPNEVRANAAAPLGAAGFNPPSLLSISAFPQTFFHNGSLTSLDAVLQNVTHRSAGTGGVDNLQDAAKRQQLVQFLLSIDAATEPIAPRAASALRVVSAASFLEGSTLAPEGAATGFGTGLAGQTVVSPSLQLPVSLGGTTVSLRDASGILRLAGLYFVSAGQVNFGVPAATAAGSADVTLTAGSGATATARVQVAAVAPAIFSANGNGRGVAAATAIRVAANGTQTAVAVFQCPSAGNCAAVPIDLGAAGESVFVTFYGTGLRRRSDLANVTCTIGGVNATVTFAGAQGEFTGLDQLNVQLPTSLRGRGEVSVVFTIDGQSTNPVTISVQ